MEDLQLVINQAQTGNREAFGTLVQRFQDMAVGYAFSILDDFYLAEDAAQEAFVQAYRDLPLLRAPAAFPSWFRRLVFKQCDRLNRKQRLPVVPLAVAGNLTADDLGLSDRVEQGELSMLIRRAITFLPEKQRQVVTLFYIADYSQKEIAVFLDIPLTTVKKRLHDARRQLKERMIPVVQDYLQENRPSQDDQFVEQVMQFIAPTQEAHQTAVYDLFELEKRPDTFQWRAGRLAHSHIDWATSRIGCVDDEAVVVAGVYDISMRIGTARVKTAGFNCNVVHPDYHDKQLALLEQSIRSSIEAMRPQGYDLSITFDDEAFWYRLGYVFGWRALQWWLQAEELPAVPLEFELHPFAANHRDDIAAFYNQENETLTGTAVRPTYRRNKHPHMFQSWYWTDAQGNLAGTLSGGDDSYFDLGLEHQKNLDQNQISEDIRRRFEAGTDWHQWPLSEQATCTTQTESEAWVILDGAHKFFIRREPTRLAVRVNAGGRFWVDEAAGEPEQILKVLGFLARESDCETIFFDRLHYKSALGKRLRQMITCRLETGTFSRSHRSYVVRIINLPSLFEKLAPALSRRLQQSHLAGWSGDLLIANDEETVMLGIEKGVITLKPVTEAAHAIRGGKAIAQLVVGSETPHEIVEMTGIQLTGEADQLIEVLFPPQYPQMENQAL